jgi:two-component system cell cycle response regulator
LSQERRQEARSAARDAANKLMRKMDPADPDTHSMVKFLKDSGLIKDRDVPRKIKEAPKPPEAAATWLSQKLDDFGGHFTGDAAVRPVRDGADTSTQQLIDHAKSIDPSQSPQHKQQALEDAKSLAEQAGQEHGKNPIEPAHASQLLDLAATTKDSAVAVEAIRAARRTNLIDPAQGDLHRLSTTDSLNPKGLENLSKSELLKLTADLQKAAHTDAVTGIPNRKAYDAAIERELLRAERNPDAPVSLLLLDLNSFKAANDLHGHTAGDQVLKQIGELLQKASREYDLVARTGGDEFSLALPNTTAEQAKAIASRLRDQIKVDVYNKDGKVTVGHQTEPGRKGENHVTVSLSIGEATSRHGVTAEELMKTADQRMYLDKKRQKAGRGVEPEALKADRAQPGDQPAVEAAKQTRALERTVAFVDQLASGAAAPHSLRTNDQLAPRGLESLSKQELIRLATDLQRSANTDAVTGLPNRKAFDAALGRELARVERNPEAPLSVLVLDLNSFKAANDLHGHTSGDQVLKQIGNLLHNELRQYDMVARTGGDEFCLILPNTTNEQAHSIAARLREKVKVDLSATGGQSTVTPSSAQAPKGSDPVTVSLSIGAATAKLGSTPQDLIKVADEAMYADKKRQKAGRGIEDSTKKANESTDAERRSTRLDDGAAARPDRPAPLPRQVENEIDASPPSGAFRDNAEATAPRAREHQPSATEIEKTQERLADRHLPRERIEEIIKEQTIPEPAKERLEDLTQRLKELPDKEQGTYRGLNSKYETLNSTELPREIARWREEFQQRVGREPEHADFTAEFLSAESPRDMRVYLVDGQPGMSILVPEDYAKTLDTVRTLRNTAENGATEAERVAAKLELRTNDEYRKAVLPEDVIPTLSELPDGGKLVKEIILDNRRNPDDGWHTLEYNQKKNGDLDSPFHSAAIAHGEEGKITVYPGANQFPGGIGELISHEWSHILEAAAKTHREAFESATHIDNMGYDKGDFGYYHRDYARYNNHEDWAVHIGEVFLAKGHDGLDAVHAMIAGIKNSESEFKVLVMARALQEQLAQAEQSGQKSIHHDQIKARVEEVFKQLLPDAQARLEKRIFAPTTTPDDRAPLVVSLASIAEKGPAHLVDLAARATDADLANSLLNFARQRSDGVLTTETLRELAKSDSALRYTALTELAGRVDLPAAEVRQINERLVDGLRNGEIAKLWQENKIDGLKALEQAIKSAGNDQQNLELFNRAIRDLQNSPAERDLLLINTAIKDRTLSERAMRILEQNPPRENTLVSQAINRGSITGDPSMQARFRELDLAVRASRSEDVALIMQIFDSRKHTALLESLKDPAGLTKQWKDGRLESSVGFTSLLKNAELSPAERFGLLSLTARNLADAPHLQRELLTSVAADPQFDLAVRRNALQQLMANPPKDPALLNSLRQLARNDADPVLKGLARVAQQASSRERLETVKSLAKQSPEADHRNAFKRAADMLEQRANTERIFKSSVNQPDLHEQSLRRLRPESQNNTARIWKEGKIDGADVISHLITKAPADRQLPALRDAVASLKDSPHLRNELLLTVVEKAGNNSNLAAEALKLLTSEARTTPETASRLIDLSRKSPHQAVRSLADELLSPAEVAPSPERPVKASKDLFDHIAEAREMAQVDSAHQDAESALLPGTVRSTERSDSDIRTDELSKQSEVRQRQTEQVIKEQTIPDHPAEPLENLTALLTPYKGIRFESTKQVKSEFQGLSTARLADKLGELNIKTYGEYEQLMLERGASQAMRVYNVKGFDNLEIVMSEKHAETLDKVRTLRQIVENASDPVDRAVAQESLQRAPYKDQVLPEDVIQHLKNLPDGGALVQRVELKEHPSKDNAWHTREFYRKQLNLKDKEFNALADAGTNASGKRSISIYPTDAQGIKELGNMVNHEWAHLLEEKNPAIEKVMKSATAYELEAAQFGEKTHFHNSYATYNHRENWAVHVEKAFLAKGIDGLDSFHAMLKAAEGGPSQFKILEMANQLERVLNQAEKTGRKSQDHEAIKNRIREARAQLLPHLLDPVKQSGHYPPAELLKLTGRFGKETHAQELLKLAADPARSAAKESLLQTAEKIYGGKIPADVLAAHAQKDSPLFTEAMTRLIHSDDLRAREQIATVLRNGDLTSLLAERKLPNDRLLYDALNALPATQRKELFSQVLDQMNKHPGLWAHTVRYAANSDKVLGQAVMDHLATRLQEPRTTELLKEMASDQYHRQRSRAEQLLSAGTAGSAQSADFRTAGTSLAAAVARLESTPKSDPTWQKAYSDAKSATEKLIRAMPNDATGMEKLMHHLGQLNLLPANLPSDLARFRSEGAGERGQLQADRRSLETNQGKQSADRLRRMFADLDNLSGTELATHVDAQAEDILDRIRAEAGQIDDG